MGGSPGLFFKGGVPGVGRCGGPSVADRIPVLFLIGGLRVTTTKVDGQPSLPTIK